MGAVSDAFATTQPGLPGSLQPSDKSYATAVVLSSLFGLIGIQHFYLGRWAEGVLDLCLSIGWVVSFAMGEPILGVALLLADLIHSFAVTIMLLTGNFKDGEGHMVCYPGQKLTIHRG
jgi:TM2 domain-containing membrane protein YozV